MGQLGRKIEKGKRKSGETNLQSPISNLTLPISHSQFPATDLRQSKGFARFMERLGWSATWIGETLVLSRKVPLVGTLIRVQRPNLPLPLEELEQLAREKKATIVKIEPNLLVDGGNPQVLGDFRKDRSPILPTRTIWINLTVSEETLLANLEKDTRNLVRRAEKDGVIVVESRDLKTFYSVWARNARDKNFFVPFEKELNALWATIPEKHLLIAKFGGQAVAAALMLGFEKVLYYSFAGSSDEGRGVHAPYLLLWEVISRGKRWGYERLDLEGITDPKVGRTKSWSGFSHFKRGFGGTEVEFAGSFSKYYSLFGKIFGRFI